MKQTVLIIVSGPPATGKTVLAGRIAARFGLPLINKDAIKETLGDVFGAGDREWSRKLGIASYMLLYEFSERMLAAGVSHVIESNFTPESAAPRFLALKEKYGFQPFEIECATEGTTLLERFMQRAERGERHPVHLDRLMRDELHETLSKGRYDSLGVGGTLYELDTTDFAAVDYERLFAAIEGALIDR